MAAAQIVTGVVPSRHPLPHLESPRCPPRSCPLPRSACLCSRNSSRFPLLRLGLALEPAAALSGQPAPPTHSWTPCCTPAASWAPVTHGTHHPQLGRS
ncbi:CAAX box protein 1-like [Manis pentadactyla]|uniref:CAAX box protein 1-like n=1 Tax=Manis pentadactyla TaxID=143292 RepID=UPI00255C8F7B|nr:CAAX box protein 1-like [Manis pentadactyla]